MAVTKFLARDLDIAISTAPGVDTIPGNSDDTWTPILGLNSLTHAPATEKADTTGFDSNGRNEHIPASRGETWTLAGHKLLDVGGGATAGDQDPGQAAVETLAGNTGLSGLGYFKITDPGGNITYFKASAEVTKHGGGHNDPASWQAVIEMSGAPTFVPAP